MNSFYFMDENLLRTIGWTLIHSLWQISLIGIIVKISLWLLRRQSAEIRYHVLLAGIISIILAFGFTFHKVYQEPTADSTITEPSLSIISNEASRLLPATGSGVMAYDQTLIEHGKALLQRNIPVISIFWILGFLFFSIRFVGGYWYLARLSKQASSASKKVVELTDNLRRRFNLQKYVQVLESASVKIPIALGYLKPVIILPTGLATAIPFNQLEAILAHELAHIKRNDFLVNLLKSLLEAIFFYHPVFWWIGQQLEHERELCCDDITIVMCGDKNSLQEALLNIELHNQKLQRIAAALYKNKFQLLNRIKRMKTNDHLNHGNRKTAAGFIVLPLLVIIFSIFTAFVPRTHDMADIAYQNNPAVPPGSEITATMPAHENEPGKSDQQMPVQKVVAVNNLDKVAIPDTTNIKYGSKIKTDDGYVLMEFDENMNLQSITKNGQDLNGEEREKYEKIAAKSKKAFDAEVTQQQKEKDLKELKKQLDQVQQKMAEVQKEYEHIMQSYIEKAEIVGNNYWPEVYAEVFDQAKQAQWLSMENFQMEVPEVPEFEMPELPEIAEGYFDAQAFQEEMAKSKDVYEEAMRDYKYQYQQQVRDRREMERAYEQEARQMERTNRDMEREVRNMERESRKIEEGLRSELLNDGLIDSWDGLKNFELNEKKLVVNGEKQPKEMHKKYLELYKNLTGKVLEGTFQISGN
ncbi:MAG: M48 family metalloprotease [Bacteroidetes bacterium]|nr:M48 family metalloprotease [Bacteroidota bacterium]